MGLIRAHRLLPPVIPDLYEGSSGDIILIFIDRRVQAKSFIHVARISRVVVPEYPHHIIQHGVRSMAIFQRGRDLSKGKPGRPPK